MALIIVIARILLEIIGLLIDRIVGQVHKQIPQVATDRGHILFSGESRKTFLIDKDPQGCDTCD